MGYLKPIQETKASSLEPRIKAQEAVLIIVLLFTVLFISGCGPQTSATYSILPDSEFFQQNSSKTRSKIDILWVVDNSGSMETSQNALAENFAAFIEDFQSRSFDYRIAVTTTEAYRAHFTGDSTYSLFRDGTDETTHSGYFVITPDTPNIQDVFMTNIIQGTNGSGDERAFHSLSEALLNPANPDFLRDDSFLSVVIISDEDDFSHDGSDFIQDSSDPALHPVNDYVYFLDQLTQSSGTSRRYNVSAMAIFDEACRDHLNNSWKGRKIGYRYQDLVTATEGLTGSLCDDFSVTLNKISENILSLATLFYLDREPEESTIVVKVDGESIPRATDSSSGGWTYVADKNAIAFSGDYIPPAGSAIQVDFDPAGLDLD